MRLDNVDSVWPSFYVVEFLTIHIEDDFGGVVEENTCGSIRKDITKSVFRGIVNPLLHP